MAVLRLQDGSHPPFGAEVKNDNEQTVGLVDDDGVVYLAGVKPGEHMSVFWSGVAHCDINLPDPLPADLFNGLLLPCQHKGNVAPCHFAGGQTGDSGTDTAGDANGTPDFNFSKPVT